MIPDTTWPNSSAEDCSDGLLVHDGPMPFKVERHGRPFWKTARYVSLALFLAVTWTALTVATTRHMFSASSEASTCNAVDLQVGSAYSTVMFPKFEQRSIFQGYPSSELEHAWSTLLNHDITKWLEVPLNHLNNLNKSVTHSEGYEWHRTSADENAPLEAVTEMWHQLHCLDLVRKYIDRDRWDYTNHNAWQWGPDRLREHVEHCVEILRVAIICTGDLTPVLEYEKDGGVWLDFETLHQCRRLG